MAKVKSVYICQNCGAESAKWIGKCPSCGEWNSYVEELVAPKSAQVRLSGSKNKPKLLSEVSYESVQRLSTANAELDRVLGGGLVAGSLVLLGGAPGIGKSTLLLQVALHMQGSILYISGEESEGQIKMRAERVGTPTNQLYLMAETALSPAIEAITILKPQLAIIDSIQTMHSEQIESAPGSVSQVRECTHELMKTAKSSGIPILLIGHITKDGAIAGPKVLEHMVDTVLQFEGDRHMSYRLLRTHKNRFGSTSEIGIYEMRGDGLREVSNPSEILLTQREGKPSGIAIGATLEGNRPLLVEVQALVTPASYGTPQRSSTGFDARRLNMLLAVLEKKIGLRLSAQDVFLNIAGGLRVEDPAIDLAVCMAIASSFYDTPLEPTLCFAGEVGLGGEIRAVRQTEQRIKEAEKLGFEAIYFSKYADLAQAAPRGLQCRALGRLDQVIQALF
jgi:DNA repair protein RadA/Sms